MKSARKLIFGIGRVWLWESYKTGVEIAYKAGWVIGFTRGFFGITGKEETDDERHARDLFIGHLNRILKILEQEGKEYDEKNSN